MNTPRYILLLLISLLFFNCSNDAQQDKPTKEKPAKLKNGKFVAKYKNGNIEKVATYKDNLLHGNQESYNKNGILQNSINYTKGLRNGKAVIYYTNGKEYRVSNYKNDKLEGERKKFRRNGALWSKQSYFNSLPSNDLIEFKDNGEIKSRPKFVIREINRIKSDNNYILELGVEGNYKKVTYYSAKLDSNNCFNVKKAFKISDQNKSKAALVISVPPGSIIDISQDLVAKITTQTNNNYYIYKKIDYSVSH